MPATNVLALVLAAGASSRFGSDKRAAILTPKKTTILQQTLQQLSKTDVDICLALKTTDHDLIHSLLPLPDALPNAPTIQTVFIHGAEQGIGVSISQSITALEPLFKQGQYSHLMICLADMPYIKTATYNAIIQAAHCSDKNIQAVIPFVPSSAQHRAGNPVMITPALFREFKALKTDIGGKAILKQVNCHWLPVDDNGIYHDIDTPNDITTYAN